MPKEKRISREQLSSVIQHELNHVRITNAGFGLNAAIEVYGKGDLIDNVGHYHIQESQTKFMINNGWYKKFDISGSSDAGAFNSQTFQKFNDAIHKLLKGTEQKININFK